jgi:hypothetical protein
VATYDELRDALRHIADLYGDPNAWQRGLSAADIADINGYLRAETDHRSGPELLPGAGHHTTGVTGWKDPATGKVYEYHPTSTGNGPQVPDKLIGGLRDHFPGLFGPNGQLATPPRGQLPPLPGGPAPVQPDPNPAGLPTGEQQSGRTADAVRRLQDELKKRYSQIAVAEEGLSEVLLNAHATTVDGQQKLNDIQKRIVEAVNNQALALDTPAGEAQFLKFLRTQVAAIGEVLSSGTLTAADQSKTIRALSDLYDADSGSTTGPGTPALAGPAAETPLDPGALPPMPDASLSDLGLGGMGGPLGGADPFPALAPALPAAMGAFPSGGGVGSPLDSLGGLAGAAAPLQGLASQLGDQARRDDTAGKDNTKDNSTKDNSTKDSSTKDSSTKDDAAKGSSVKDDTKTAPGQQGPAPPQPAPAATVPASGAPPGGPGAAPPPSTTVALPDGSTANASTPAAAQAVKAYLAGTPLDAAYRQAGVELPPPGTPVTAPIDPSQLAAGDVGEFKDHYVVALGTAKALQDGQVVALSSVSSSPDFLGWMRPAAPATAAAPAATG